MKAKSFFINFSFFLSFITSMNVWFAWNRNDLYINFILAIYFCYLLFNLKSLFCYNKRNILSCLIITIAYVYFMTFNNILGLLASIAPLIHYYAIILLRNNYKEVFLAQITKWLAYLLIPSLILYLITLIVDIPSLGYLNNEVGYLPYKNYLLLVKSESYFMRFTGPFAEPGHLGMMISFLLFSNKFNLKKWENFVILITGIFTFSLTCYVTIIVSYIFVRMSSNSLSIKSITVFSLIIITIYTFSINYNNGKNYINEKIIERLEFDEDKGFKGNNRVFGEIDDYYDFLLKSSKYFWTGYDDKTIQYLIDNKSGGTGYYMHVIKYGFLGVFMALSFYLFYAIFSSNNKKASLLFFVFICLLFWQRNCHFWTSWIICFVWGLNNYKLSNNLNIKKYGKSYNINNNTSL